MEQQSVEMEHHDVN